MFFAVDNHLTNFLSTNTQEQKYLSNIPIKYIIWSNLA